MTIHEDVAYALTDEQAKWFDAGVLKESEPYRLSEGRIVYHGYMLELPELHNARSFWITDDPFEAAWYSTGGALGGVMKLRVRTSVELTRVNFSVTKFVEAFDGKGGLNIGLNHDHYARRLHSWATERGIDGIFDRVGDVALFRAADLLEPLEEMDATPGQ